MPSSILSTVHSEFGIAWLIVRCAGVKLVLERMELSMTIECVRLLD